VDKIFAFDPFDTENQSGDDHSGGLQKEGEIVSPMAKDNYEPLGSPQDLSEDPFRDLLEQAPLGQGQYDEQCPSPLTSPAYYPSHYVCPPTPTLAPASSSTKYFSANQADVCDGLESEPESCSSHTWHQSLLSSLHDGTPIDPEILEREYVQHIYKTPGPVFAIPELPISTPSTKTFDFAHFDSPTEDPLSDVNTAVQHTSDQDRLLVGHRGLVERQVGVIVTTPTAKVFAMPVTPSPLTVHPYEDLDFRWTKFNRNDIVVGLPESAARHRPIFQLDDITASSDVENGSDVMSSLLLRRPRSRQDSSRLGRQSTEANRDSFTTPTLPRKPSGHVAPVEAEDNRGSLQEKDEFLGAASFQLDEPFTPTPLPLTPVKRSELHGQIESPSQNLERQLDSDFTVVREDSIRTGSAGGGIKSALATPESTPKPKPKPAFAPAPGIYISPLRGSGTKDLDTSKKKDDVRTPFILSFA
jgi:hypothetical protein